MLLQTSKCGGKCRVRVRQRVKMDGLGLETRERGSSQPARGDLSYDPEMRTMLAFPGTQTAEPAGRREQGARCGHAPLVGQQEPSSVTNATAPWWSQILDPAHVRLAASSQAKLLTLQFLIFKLKLLYTSPPKLVKDQNYNIQTN